MNSNALKIREYGRTELAVKLYENITPQGAWKRLRRRIDANPELKAKLKSLGYNEHQRLFTPSQVRVLLAANLKFVALMICARFWRFSSVALLAYPSFLPTSSSSVCRSCFFGW